jgi:threonylcarbamoyladenosine tRNA methylthiotransferase MtaB
MANYYIKKGHTVVHKFVSDADLYVVNTCAVTSFAQKKSRYQLSRIQRTNPAAEVIVCGCASDRSLNTSISCIAVQPRRRAIIKVQDGCNNFCSYCKVPYLRGRSKSRSIDDIVAEIQQVNKPVVLTGIDLSSFGLDTGTNLGELCAAVDACGNLFELSSIEAGIITSDFLDGLKRCKNFIPKFHIPLQSASDKVLADMNRKYKFETYGAKINLVREVFPDAKITTDVIIGFPTESDRDFLRSCSRIRRLGFEKVHVFPYSKRKGTAAEILGELQPSTVSARVDTFNKVLGQK